MTVTKGAQAFDALTTTLLELHRQGLKPHCDGDDRFISEHEQEREQSRAALPKMPGL